MITNFLLDIFVTMEDKLFNPVYNALLSGDAHLAFGTEKVKYFDEQVSPFAGFHVDNDKGFDELYDLLPAGRGIIHATPGEMGEPKGWQVKVALKGLQFIYPPENKVDEDPIEPVPLSTEHVAEMVQLATLTKPGPFSTRTIEFGHYHGISKKSPGCHDRSAPACGRLYRDQCGMYASRFFRKRICGGFDAAPGEIYTFSKSNSFFARACGQQQGYRFI